MNKLLTVCFIFLLGCKSPKKSGLADPPCIFVKLESPYVILGYSYDAEIILNCDRPESIDQISAHAICVSEHDSMQNEKPTRFVDFYIEKNRIYCKYYGVSQGLNFLKGDLLIKTQNGDSIIHPFNEPFYSARPFSLVSCVQDKYLLLGKENTIDVSAPGIASENLIVTATNANLKKNSNYGSGLFEYVVFPLSDNYVEISVFTRNRHTIIPLATWKMKVINEFPNMK